MERIFCLSAEELRGAKASLLLAKKIGLIEDESLDALEARRQQKNEQNRKMEAAGELFYGPRYYSAPAYLQYELTRFKLDFSQPTEMVRKSGLCPEITEADKKKFYAENHDLFGRYHGDSFSYEEVEQIIEKRLREAAYDRLVQDLLCQFNDGQ